MDKKKVLDSILETKVLPLFYEGDISIARKLLDACFEGGGRLIEFTNRGDKALEVFKDLLEYSSQKYPEMILGVGSISSVEQAEQFLNVGAHFLVSPFIDKDIADYCKEKNVLWTGGCATLTELQTAYKWGVPIMKAFPGNVLGPGFIKAAKAPCPWLKIMPTGGVKPERDNLTAWYQAGASCVGMGSRLFVKDSDGNFDFDKIKELLAFSIALANE